MSYFTISRSRFSSLISMSDTTFNSKQGTFNAMFANPEHTVLSIADIVLEVGDYVTATNTFPEIDYIILKKEQKINHESYTVGRLEYSATVQRFDIEGTPKDAFGRLTTAEPATIYIKMPLYLEPAERSKYVSSKDRTAVLTQYHFTTSTDYQLQKADLLTIGGKQLTITTLLLSPAGLVEFIAEATA